MINKQITNRIVVIGGSGFVGVNLLRLLIEKGHNNLVVIGRNDPAIPGIIFINGDFSDIDLTRKVLRENDIVIHLACTTIPSTSELDKERDIRENIIGTLRLLEACREKKIKRIIFISSGGTVYGKMIKPVDENHEPRPANAHGLMKFTIEKYLELFNGLYGLNFVIVRPSNLYGRTVDNKRVQGSVDIFLKRLINDEVIEIWGDGSIIRDYIHIDDFSRLLVKIIESEIENQIINASTGIGTSINELLEIIKNATGREIKVEYLLNRNFDLPYNVLVNKKALDLFGWRPRISMEDGIKELYKKNINNIN